MLGTAPDIKVVAEADSGNEALRLVEQCDVDVALIDISLPDKGGLDVLKTIKTRKSGVSILVLSMHPEDTYAMRALRAGAAGYLTKDVSTSTLVTAVRRAAAGRKYFSEAMLETLAGRLAGEPTSMDESLETLSDRELEVLKLFASGVRPADIAETLHLSPNTVTTYRARIMEKMGFDNNVALVRYALEKRLVS